MIDFFKKNHDFASQFYAHSHSIQYKAVFCVC